MTEVEAAGPGRVTGRCFIKQDHQGATPGFAHEGVIAAALGEAMALSCGPDARLRQIAVELTAEAPVGAFVDLDARSESDGTAEARASVEGRTVASARGLCR